MLYLKKRKTKIQPLFLSKNRIMFMHVWTFGKDIFIHHFHIINVSGLVVSSFVWCLTVIPYASNKISIRQQVAGEHKNRLLSPFSWTREWARTGCFVCKSFKFEQINYKLSFNWLIYLFIKLIDLVLGLSIQPWYIVLE